MIELFFVIGLCVVAFVALLFAAFAREWSDPDWL